MKDNYIITLEYKLTFKILEKDEDGRDFGLPTKEDIRSAINQELNELFSRENYGLQVLPYYTIETLKDKRSIKIK